MNEIPAIACKILTKIPETKIANRQLFYPVSGIAFWKGSKLNILRSHFTQFRSCAIERTLGYPGSKSPQFQAGKVREVIGEGETAKVVARISGDAEVVFEAKHLLKIPTDDRDSVLDKSSHGMGASEDLLGGLQQLAGNLEQLRDRLARDVTRSRSDSSSSSSSSSSNSSVAETEHSETSATNKQPPEVEAGPSNAASLPTGQNATKIFCAVCSNDEKLVALKCGHVLCEKCSHKLPKEDPDSYKKCPICNKKFKKVINLFV